jgi:hypothetical protein
MPEPTAPRGTKDESVLEPDPAIEVYKSGVDRSLLRRSIDERVRTLIAALRFATAPGEAGRRERNTR